MVEVTIDIVDLRIELKIEMGCRKTVISNWLDCVFDAAVVQTWHRDQECCNDLHPHLTRWSIFALAFCQLWFVKEAI